MTQQTSPNVMHQWFQYLFDQRKDKDGFIDCFECGTFLHEMNYRDITICYSHLLEKSKYPQYAGDERNVVITCPDCHNLYTMRPKQAIKQYEAAQQLKKLYNI